MKVEKLLDTVTGGILVLMAVLGPGLARMVAVVAGLFIVVNNAPDITEDSDTSTGDTNG